MAGGANEQLGDAGGRRAELDPPSQSWTRSWSARRPLGSSTLEEAGRVLHEVQRQKKVLEENIQALQRARSAELLFSQLEALADIG